ncbi:MAG TPA: hypothetical protein ENI26_13930 [Methylophaga aminisulfidivorans]|uniref:Uncharacterized protein n=2 Tax=root TaxID=1 RepID=A0A7C1ZTS9_9GAMM|nr:hypothetical protein [Methylophaga aminisulfidivorans]
MTGILSNTIRLSLIGLLVGTLTACTEERTPTQSWQHSTNGSYAAAFSPDGRYVLVGDIDEPAKLWDIEKNELKYAWQNTEGDAGTTTDVAFSHDGKVAATVESNIIVLWNMENGKPMTRLTFPTTVKDIALSPRGEFLLMALQDRTAVYFDVIRNRVIQIFKHDGKAVGSDIDQLINTVTISPNGKYGLTGGDDHTARMWDLETGKQLRTWLHGNSVNLVTFSPSGASVVSSAGNDQTRIWDVRSGKQTAVLNTSDIDVDGIWGDFPVFKTTTTALAYSQKGKYLVTGHPNREMCVWRAKDGHAYGCWKIPRKAELKPGVVIEALGFSPDGRNIYSEAGNGLGQKWRFR